MEKSLIMADRIKIFAKSVFVVIALTLINMLLLVGSFMLPTSRMRQHVADSYLLIEAEEPYLEWDTYYFSTRLDFWSEYTEYGMAINGDSEGSPFEQAMYMRFIDTEGRPRDVSVKDYARNPDDYFEQGEYPRYWNGIVIIYKVLLLFFTIADIRILNMFLQVSLLCLIVYLMIKKNLSQHIFYFLIAVLFINPVTMLMSLKFSSEYVPMLLGIIIILFWGDKIEKINGGWIYYFSIMGAITSFLCMLSAPGITLGIPLLFVIWMTNEKNVIPKAIYATFYWLLAYGITWVMKWIICTLFTPYNLLADAFERASYYNTEQGDTVSLADRIMANILIYNHSGYKVLLFVAVVLVVFTVVWNGAKNIEHNYDGGLIDSISGYFIVLLIPFVIFTIFGNGYSYEHSYMAHRQLAIAVVAGLCILRILMTKGLDVFYGRKGK